MMMIVINSLCYIPVPIFTTIFQEVTEDLDPSLSPILRRETFSRGGHQVMRLGDTEIEYNENFR